MTSNIDVPIPYTPIGAPTVEFVEYNKANFKTVTWKVPESVPYKGKIIYVHGFAEDSTIYTEFFDNLSQAGYEVFFFDQRGAGETSPGKLVGQTNEFYVFDDLDFFVKRNLDARTDKSEKFYMLGHSMGGGIVLNYGIRGKYVDDIRGILACGPLVQLHDDSKPNIVLRGLQPVINHLLPSFTIDSKLKYDYITSSERYRNYFVKKDMKLIGSVRQFNDMFVRGEKLLDPKYAALFKNELPLLIIHGTDDHINDIEASEKFYKLVPNELGNKHLDKIEKARHSLFIESEELYTLIFKKVLDFLNEN